MFSERCGDRLALSIWTTRLSRIDLIFINKSQLVEIVVTCEFVDYIIYFVVPCVRTNGRIGVRYEAGGTANGVVIEGRLHFRLSARGDKEEFQKSTNGAFGEVLKEIQNFTV